jgi:hypothetical protein
MKAEIRELYKQQARPGGRGEGSKKGAFPMSINDLTTTASEYREIQAMIKELEAEAEALKQQMIREIDARKVDTLAAGIHTIRYTLYESARLDGAKLKADQAAMYDQYSKKTVSTRFQVA